MTEKQCCSYCQREYGTLSTNNKPIKRTIDHIKKRSGLELRSIDRSGIMSKGVKDLSEVDNFLQCCNECNLLKGELTLRQLKRKIRRFLDHKYESKARAYLTVNLVKTIQNSILIILNSPCEPVLMGWELELTN